MYIDKANGQQQLLVIVSPTMVDRDRYVVTAIMNQLLLIWTSLISIF